MALDLGSRRIGVALSDPLGIIGQPFGMIERSDVSTEGAALRLIVAEQEVEEVVVGLPFTLAGAEGPAARAVREWLGAIEGELAIPIHTWDERLTTAAAQRVLVSGGVRRARRKRVVDQMAAALILQSYLDARRR